MYSGTTSASELLVELDRGARAPLRSQLEDGLREAVRSGRLRPSSRLPATRVLAADLGISRRLVVDAYAQLLAEGYLVARHGSGTFVAEAAAAPSAPVPEARERALSFDFFPGYPDLAGFPRRAWLRALRGALAAAPDGAFGYPDPRGEPALRRALAGHLRRVRGLAADPESIVVTSGAAQALALIARVLAPGPIAVEDPGLPRHREILRAHGATLEPLPVDEQGACVGALERIAGPRGGPVAALVTPAHQSPLGVALAPARRAELLGWAAASGAIVIEDDYDAEYRYDRAPLGALQGLAPERVLYLGTASKTLAPALRLGWAVLPARLLDGFVAQKGLADNGSPSVDQLALARLLESGDYDRHLRQARRRYRARRDALVAAVAEHLPGARVTGVAAGLHAVVRLGGSIDGLAVMRAARRRSVGVYPLGYAYMRARPREDGLILGYANLAEPAIEEGIRRLGEVIRELAPGPAAT